MFNISNGSELDAMMVFAAVEILKLTPKHNFSTRYNRNNSVWITGQTSRFSTVRAFFSMNSMIMAATSFLVADSMPSRPRISSPV